MGAITEVEIRRLANFRGERAPVTSCYLDIDGRRHRTRRDYEEELAALLRRAEWKVADTPSVADDFRAIKAFVGGGIDRSKTRGLALFACSAHDFFKAVELPVPVRSQVVVNPMPAVRQLEHVVRTYERIGVLLADRQRARVLVFELGELVEHSELFDELPRDYDLRDERARGDNSPHQDALAARHLRNAVEAAWNLFGSVGFEHLVIGAPDPIASQLEALLHPYLASRVRGRVALTPTTNDGAILTAVLDVEGRIELEREVALVAALREAIGEGRRAVGGLEPVLLALGERRLERLVVSQGYSEAGWLCRGCGHLAVVGRACARCGADMERINDVVEEAVEEALAQACAIDICLNNADLDCIGRIGGLLRF